MNSNNALSSEIRKLLLGLNTIIPRENVNVWITVEEMRDRLVFCGVDDSLTSDTLSSALRYSNKLGVIERRVYLDVCYFRPALCASNPGAPLDQRVKPNGHFRRHGCLPISLPRGFLESTPAAKSKLVAINAALSKLTEDTDDDEDIVVIFHPRGNEG